MTDAKEKIIKILEQKPEYLEILKELLDVEDTNPMDGSPWLDRSPHGRGWEAGYHYNINPGRLAYLMGQNILCKWGSNRTKCYGFNDPEAVREALAYVENKSEIIRQGYQEAQVPEDLFDVIVDHADLLKLIRMILDADKPIHLLMKGPPSTAKSAIMLEIARLPGAYYYVCTTSSKAGVNKVLLDHEPLYLLGDEFDKWPNEDMSVLLSLMETGIVSNTKANNITQKQLPTRVFAAANDLSRIPKEMLSRFEVVNLRDYTPDEFKAVVVNVLTRREGIAQDIAEYIAAAVLILPKASRDVREAIRIARIAQNDKEKIDWFIEFKRSH